MSSIEWILALIGGYILTVYLHTVLAREPPPSAAEPRRIASLQQQLRLYLTNKLPLLRQPEHKTKPIDVYLPQRLCDALQDANMLHATLNEIETTEGDVLILCTRSQTYRVILLDSNSETRQHSLVKVL